MEIDDLRVLNDALDVRRDLGKGDINGLQENHFKRRKRCQKSPNL